MRRLKQLALFGAIYLIVLSISFFGLHLDLSKVSLWLQLAALSLGLMVFVPPFALRPLQIILSFYKSTPFWRLNVGTEQEQDKFKDFERLDKLIGLSRNILLIIATLGAVIIALTSEGLGDFFWNKEITVQGAIDTNCHGEWNPDFSVDNVFLVLKFRSSLLKNKKTKEPDYLKDPTTKQVIREIIKVEQGHYSKTIKIPRTVKYIEMEVFPKELYGKCDQLDIEEGVESIDIRQQELVYQDIMVQALIPAESNGQLKKKPKNEKDEKILKQS